MNKWEDLTLSQKADLFKIYAANGFTSVDSIKEHYNKFEDGGPVQTDFVDYMNSGRYRTATFLYDDYKAKENERAVNNAKIRVPYKSLTEVDSTPINNPKEMAETSAFVEEIYPRFYNPEYYGVSEYPTASLAYLINNEEQKELRTRDIEYSIPYIPEKKITFTNAGKSSGATISTNMLDTLAKYGSKVKDIPLNVIFGIPAQETEMGKYAGTYYKTDYSDNSDNNFINNNRVLPSELVNNHYYYSTPMQDLIATVANRAKVGNYNQKGKVTSFIPINEFSPQVEQYMREGWNHTMKSQDSYDFNKHPLISAFERFKSGKYNSKLEGSSEKIINAGNNIINSPEFKKWYKDEGYKWFTDKNVK